MEPDLAVFTAARRYLMDRRAHWSAEHGRIVREGHRLAGSGYTDEAKRTFPRYQVLDAILVDVERLNADQLPGHAELVEWLRLAGEAAESMFTTPEDDPIKLAAMTDERHAFLEFVQGVVLDPPTDVEQLPFRHTLEAEDGERWRELISQRWPIEHGGWWAPMTLDNPPAGTICVEAQPFHAHAATDGTAGEGIEGVATIAVREALHSLGVRRAVEIREYGPDIEVDVSLLWPVYTGAEGLITSGTAEWLIFASHESVTALGGTIVPAFERAWPEWTSSRWNGWAL